MKKAAFSLENPYDMMSVLGVREYLKLLADGGLKEESATKAATSYTRVINNCSIEWFARQIGTCGDYFVKHKKLLVIKQGVHKKIDSYIDDGDIRSTIMAWLRSQNPPQQTGHNLR